MRDSPPSMTEKMGTTPHPVCGIGKVTFDIKDCNKIKTVHLKEALYISSMQRNLISISKMDWAGYQCKDTQ